MVLPIKGTKIIKTRSTKSRVENLPLAIVQLSGFLTFKVNIINFYIYHSVLTPEVPEAPDISYDFLSDNLAINFD